MTFVHVLRTEFLKLRHSKVTWLSLVAFGLAPLAIALMMWIVREPDRAARLGLLGAKAKLAGLAATWPSYSSMITQVVGSGGLIFLAFIVAYVFGREYSDGTAKNLLALPVGRHYFVLAKFVVAGVWWAVLTLFSLVEAFAVGFALQLPEFSGGLAAAMVGRTLSAAAISFLLAPVVAWIATLARGYLAPLAFAIGTLLLGTLLSKTGWADWFPWTIVPSLVGSLGGSGEAPGMASLAVVAAVFFLGVGATVAQLRYADNNQ
ncbi:MAG: ABC transporter permease [Thermoleophilia bacterium]|nr:ABC transporter permease [Thermoleophilia bacterium]